MIPKKITVKKFKLKKLNKYKHPSISLFRGIELKTLEKKLKNIELRGPSLDLGCGDGYITSLIFKSIFDYGIDNNEAGDVKIAIKKKRYKKIVIESAEKTSIPSGSLSFVFSNSVIEHIPNNQEVLKEVSRMLKKGGYFVFTCPSAFFTKYLSKNFGGEWYSNIRNKQFNHYHLLTQPEWSKRLRFAGLKLVNYYYYMDEKALVFWEKSLWQYKLNRMLPFLFESPCVYDKEISKFIYKSKTSKESGANILVIAKK